MSWKYMSVTDGGVCPQANGCQKGIADQFEMGKHK